MNLVYFSPVALNSPAQRPHHFVAWWRERYGGQVLWVEPYPTRLPAWQDLRRLSSLSRSPPPLGPSWAQMPWLTVLRPSFLPVEPWAFGRLLNRINYAQYLLELQDWITPNTLVAVGKPSELAIQMCRLVGHGHVLYDVMDFFHLFNQGTSSKWMQSLHQRMLPHADIVWASASALLQSVQENTAVPVHLVPNAATMPPCSTESLLAPLPSRTVGTTLGYIGSIAPWLDWGLLIKLAQALPQCRLVLIGPVHTQVPPLPSNIELHPPIPHEMVYQAMSEFSAGLIPFLDNALTKGVDPVKYYEYRTAGLPVLSTRFGEMRQRTPADGVWFLDDEPFSELQYNLPAWQSSLLPADAFVAENNWSFRFGLKAYTLPCT